MKSRRHYRAAAEKDSAVAIHREEFTKAKQAHGRYLIVFGDTVPGAAIDPYAGSAIRVAFDARTRFAPVAAEQDPAEVMERAFGPGSHYPWIECVYDLYQGTYEDALAGKQILPSPALARFEDLRAL